MHCNNYRTELSEHLDGRLPSGRRGAVLDHLADCAECTDYWEELQAAQDMALQAPTERITHAFQDGLWERIRSGEGTPEAVFHEPIPLLSKARYALTGAAAAAAVILFWLAFNGPESTTPTTSNAADSAQSNIEGDPSITDPPPSLTDTVGTVVYDPASVSEPVKPLAPPNIAFEAARGVALNHDRLREQLAVLEVGKDGSLDKVMPSIEDLQRMGNLLLKLERERFVQLDEPARGQLVTVCDIQPNKLRRDNAPVRSLRQLVNRTGQLASLPTRMQTRHAFTPQQVERFLSRMMREPQLLQPFVIVSSTRNGEQVEFLQMDLKTMNARSNRSTELFFINPSNLVDRDVRVFSGPQNVQFKLEIQGSQWRISETKAPGFKRDE